MPNPQDSATSDSTQATADRRSFRNIALLDTVADLAARHLGSGTHDPTTRFNRMTVKLASRFRLVFALFLLSLVFATILYALIEHLRLSDSFEWAYQTALTIGYGDFPPHTLLGRVLTAVFGHFWVWSIVPFIAARIILAVQHDKNEYTHKEQEWTAQVLMLICAKLDITPPPPPADTDLGNLNDNEELA
jgi:hypothetical protein